jgi:hypothetical protein
LHKTQSVLDGFQYFFLLKMSLSKLESLPNEILTDIIEKYINGVDVLKALSYQLNRRFDALISQCQRLHFNFIQCHKNDFRLCMDLLPAYIDKIEELAISEEHAPGQVSAFLKNFPSFAPFERLRTLYFHFDGDTVDSEMLITALLSLSSIAINSLTITVMNSDFTTSMKTIISTLFSLKTLKRISLVSDEIYFEWDDVLSTPSNIEYMTIYGLCCKSGDLPYICQFTPHLKYLEIYVYNNVYYYYNFEPMVHRGKNIIFTSELRTLILSLKQCPPTGMI